MQLKNIQLEYKDDICLITINRPDVRNALNYETIDEINLALDDVEKRSPMPIVVFTGAGTKAFSAGADITGIPKRTIFDAFEAKHSNLCHRVEQLPTPTIAMVNGFALGGGCELALSCDIRVASTNAKFGLPETTLSIIPGAGGTQRLTRMVGVSRALDMILTGKFITAEEANQMGIAQYICEPEQLYETTMDVVGKIRQKGPLAIQLVREVIRRGFETDQQTALYMEKLVQAILYTTEDKNEGAQAFLEKRKPNFQGK